MSAEAYQMTALQKGRTIEESHDSKHSDDPPFYIKNNKNILTGESLNRPTPLNCYHLLIVIIGVFFTFGAVKLDMGTFPSIPTLQELGVSDVSNNAALDTADYVMERAKFHMLELAKRGPRPMQSAGAISARQYINAQLESLAGSAKSEFNFQYRIRDIYLGVNNVVARLGTATEKSLLVNCHYDSVPAAPGASDNGLNCAIMLEIIRALLSASSPPKQTIIFLFNEGEEVDMLGAKAFLRNDPWAPSVSVFINLDGAGAGGREILFQSGPGSQSSIMVEAYAAGTKFPFATVIGQEVFEAGLIPSYTDYETFSVEGRRPGLDIAYYANGYVYHTKYDTADRVPDGTIYRAGVNFLGIIQHLVQEVDFKTIARLDGSASVKLVYFDFFGSGMIVYDYASVGVAINSVLVALVFIRIIVRAVTLKRRYLLSLAAGFLAQFLSLLVAAGMLFFIAFLLTIPAPSSAYWYARPLLLAPIHVLPAITLAMVVQALVYKFVIIRCCFRDEGSYSHATICQTAHDASLDVALFIISIIVILTTAMNIASGYLFSLFWLGWILIFDTVFWLLQTFIYRNMVSNTSWHRSLFSLFRHTAVTFLPTFYYFYITNIMIETFIPVAGRYDSVDPAQEYLIAAIVALMTIIPLLFHYPLINLVGGNIIRLIPLSVILILSGMIVLLVSPKKSPFEGKD